jgi:hypothetical protein
MDERNMPPPYSPLHWRHSCQGGPDSFQVRDRLNGNALVADGLSYTEAHELAARLEARRPRCGLRESVCWYCRARPSAPAAAAAGCSPT